MPWAISPFGKARLMLTTRIESFLTTQPRWIIASACLAAMLLAPVIGRVIGTVCNGGSFAWLTHM